MMACLASVHVLCLWLAHLRDHMSLSQEVNLSESESFAGADEPPAAPRGT